ncbi:MAG TPA: phosphatase PAP2 family protein [Bacillota bacterium]|nr:phosphatase PAP2 family protein [Bacillota bacterium]
MNQTKQHMVTIGSFLLFLAVVFIFMGERGLAYDEQFISFVQTLSSGTLLSLMNVLTIIGSSEVILLITALIAGIYLLRRDWIMMIFFLVLSVGGVILNLGLKLAIQKERPDGDISYIEVFNYVLEIPSYSFPSGHTMRSTILFLFLMFVVSRVVRSEGVKIVAYIGFSLLIALVAFSRFFLEAHYLSDTLGAITISIAWFSFCLTSFRRNKRSTRYRS